MFGKKSVGIDPKRKQATPKLKEHIPGVKSPPHPPTANVQSNASYNFSTKNVIHSVAWCVPPVGIRAHWFYSHLG